MAMSPDRAEASLLAVERAGREALAEMAAAAGSARHRAGSPRADPAARAR